MFAALLAPLAFRKPLLCNEVSLGGQTARFLAVQRARVGFGDGRRWAQDSFFDATGAGAIARRERFVIAPHHEMIAESRFARILRRAISVEPEILLRSIRQEPRENLRGRQMRI